MQSQLLTESQQKIMNKLNIARKMLLHKSSQSKIALVPFFIRHSDPNQERDLSIKVIHYKKAGPAYKQDYEINLPPTAAVMLKDKLNELFAVRRVPEEGNFLVIRMGSGTKVDLNGLDSHDVAKAVISILENEEITKSIDAVDFSDDLAFAFRNSIRVKGLIKAMQALEDALETEDSEQYYQEWCEENGWIFGNQYVLKDDERKISRNDTVDLLATSVISGFRDIIELKKPSFAVLNYDSSHDSYYFSAEVSKAIGQCHRYLDVFSEDAVSGLRDNPEIVAYHPRATIIIGRSNTWDKSKHRALYGLNSRMNGVTVLTYDHLLRQGKRLIEILRNDESRYDFDY